MCELEKYMDELKENQPDESIGRALSEYAAIVSGVAEDYTDDVTEQELRQDHPELDFMDEGEIYEVLRQARLLRMRTDTQQNTITNQQ